MEFVGRSRELAGLHSLWRDADLGRTRVAVITGPSGIGKTRLAQELLSNAVGMEVRSVSLKGTHGEMKLRWGAASDFIRQLLRLPGSAGISSASDSLLKAMLYPPGHPYAHTIIGEMDDLGSVSLPDVRDFFERHYRPDNASLCIAGDLDPHHAVAGNEELAAALSSPSVDLLQVEHRRRVDHGQAVAWHARGDDLITWNQAVGEVETQFILGNRRLWVGSDDRENNDRDAHHNGGHRHPPTARDQPRDPCRHRQSLPPKKPCRDADFNAKAAKAA